MTRINVIPVEILKNDHLLAEYRELPRIFTAIYKKIEQDQAFEQITKDIPDSYKLGSGHVTFFYNKLRYLYKRYTNLIDELHKRGYDLDINIYKSVLRQYINCLDNSELFLQLNNDYQPDHAAIYLNMARLAKRSNIEQVLKELNS